MSKRACVHCASVMTGQYHPCAVCYSPKIYSYRGGRISSPIGPEYSRNAYQGKERSRPRIRLLNAFNQKELRVTKLDIRQRLRLRSREGEESRNERRRNGLRASALTLGFHLLLMAVAVFVVEHQVRTEDFIGVTFQAADVSAEVTNTAMDSAALPDIQPRFVKNMNELKISRLQDHLPKTSLLPQEAVVVEVKDLFREQELAYRGQGMLMPLAKSASAASLKTKGELIEESVAVETEDLLKNRRGDKRKLALDEYGGRLEVLDAVEDALAFLKRTQQNDGSWNADGTKGRERFSNPAVVSGTDVGITSLALLCFMGAGHGTESRDYGRVVKRGLKWLIERQCVDGSVSEDEFHYGHDVYNTAVAALALSEATLLHPTKLEYREAATRSITFFVRSQNVKGGWTYSSRPSTGAERSARSDTSISGWVVLALTMARYAEIETPERNFERMENLFDEMSDHETGELLYADASPHVNRRGIGLVGVGLACRRMLNPSRFAELDGKAVDLLVQDPPEWSALRRTSRGSSDPNLTTTYGWYYSSLGMFMATGGKGKDWRTWSEALQDTLLGHQQQSGRDRGSWDPDETWLGAYYGRLYSTTMACLSLEVYFRYDPFAERVLAPVTGETDLR